MFIYVTRINQSVTESSVPQSLFSLREVTAAPACSAQPGFAESARAPVSGHGWWCAGWAWLPPGSARTTGVGSTVDPGERGRPTQQPGGGTRGGGGPMQLCRHPWGRNTERNRFYVGAEPEPADLSKSGCHKHGAKTSEYWWRHHWIPAPSAV